MGSSIARKRGRPVTYATDALGKELLRRLQHGERLDATVSRGLRLALDDVGDVTDATSGSLRHRLPETPLTDEGLTTQDAVKPAAEDDDYCDDEPPKKRSRAEPTPRSSQRHGVKTDSVPRSFINRQQSKTRSRVSQRQSEEDAEDAEQQVVSAPEVRRSDRKAQPAKRHANMVSWRDDEVRGKMRGIRHSVV